MSLNGFAKALRGLAWKRRALWSDERAAEELGWGVEKLRAVEAGEGSVWEMDAILRLVGAELGRMAGVRRVKAPGEWAAKEAVRVLGETELECCGVCGTRKGRVLGCRCDREAGRAGGSG